MDTTRPDHLSVYGYRRATSPTLERLASEGLRFDLAYAPTATTGPSHASVFTSRYPISHRVLKNGQVLAPEFVTMAELLSRNGWDTAAVVSSFVLNAKFGYDQGFASYDDEFPDRDDDGNTEREIFLYRRHYAGGKVQGGGGLSAVGEKFGLRRGNWKLIEGPAEHTRELFDLATDPAEQQNLAERDPERTEAMLQRLRAWQRRYERDDVDPASVAPDDREGLRALGYVD